MHTIRDTWTLTKRSLRHTVRSLDTIITVAAMPIGTMLMMVYVFGGAIDTGSIKYIDFVVPGVIIMTVISGIAYAAFRLNNDLNKGFINRFRCMPVASSSVLGGHVVSSVLSNLFSVLLVLLVALLVGFRPNSTGVTWLQFSGLILLLTTAFTWLAIVFGLLAETAEGAGAFSYILMFMIFISSAFIPTDKMNPVLGAFAAYQPMTPIADTLRYMLVRGTTGNEMITAVLWCFGILVASYTIALQIYKRRTV